MTESENKAGTLVQRLRTMAALGWNPIGAEAANEIERLQQLIPGQLLPPNTPSPELTPAELDPVAGLIAAALASSDESLCAMAIKAKAAIDSGTKPGNWRQLSHQQNRRMFESYAAQMGLRDFEEHEYGYRNPFTAGPFAYWEAGQAALRFANVAEVPGTAGPTEN